MRPPAGVAPGSAPLAPRRDARALQLAKGAAITWRALYFPRGQATLLPAVAASLDTLAQLLRLYPHVRVEVQGHTDNQGDSLLNRLLSCQRAAAVCAYLAAHGVAAGRLRPVGLGGTRPVADNGQPAQRTRNRRVVLRPLP
jgi:outer membrane protein OmpA-like peptidoglycan-associated protein